MTTTTADTQTRTVEAPGATITYDIRPNETSTQTPLFILGSPMGASGFVGLASRFPDRAIVTYDPRGAERSTKADPSTESTPQQHAEDIHAVIQATGLGPVDLFATSGGAVNALALVAAHPDDVRTLVAHEPPLAALLPDAENAKAAVRAVQRSYQDGGFGKGMAHFIAVVGYKGAIPDGFGDQPGPDPAMFGLPAGDDGSRNDVLLAEHHHLYPFRAGLRRARRGLDANRARRGG
jgi:pimeloyl-ACP methyl ester carboxylesterase